MRRSPSGIRNGPSVTRLAALTIVIVLGCWTALETHLSSRASRAANDKATTHAEIAQSIAAAELEVNELRGRIQSLANSNTEADARSVSANDNRFNSASSDSVVWSSSASSSLSPGVPHKASELEHPSSFSSFSQPSKRINGKEARRKTNGASARPVQSDGGGIPGGGLVPRKRERATRVNAAAMVRATASAAGKGKGSKDGSTCGLLDRERKCSHSAVKELMATRALEISNSNKRAAWQVLPFEVLDPKDPKLTPLNDFPCSETEMHACACQVKCRDPSCSIAVDLCIKYNSNRTSSNSIRCAAIALGDGQVWATLKRSATHDESSFLHLSNAKTRAEADSMVSAMVASRPEWRPQSSTLKGPAPLSSSSPSSATLRHTMSNTAALIRPYLRNTGIDSEANSEVNEDPADTQLCRGGALQSGTAAASVRGRKAPLSQALSQHEQAAAWESFLTHKLGIIALSMQTPASLAASMSSWQASGLLNLVGNEKIAFLSEPAPSELALSSYFGFSIVEPRQLSSVDPKRRAGPNKLTIGSAFYHALLHATSDYVLFLEKDFAIDAKDISVDDLAAELLSAAWLLHEGALIVRLRSHRDKGCSGFRTCEKDANKPVWAGKSTRDRRRNWLSFYCDKAVNTARASSGKGTVQSCVGSANDHTSSGSISSGGGSGSGSSTAQMKSTPSSSSSSSSSPRPPHFRCYSSRDSNWTLNAVMVHRRGALEQILKDPTSAGKGGNWSFGSLAMYGETKFDDQAGFERGMLEDDWGRLKVPVCLSTRGVFRHNEVDN